MDWKSLVASVSPVLGAAVGGPFGGMAGKWLAGQLDVEPDKLEEFVLGADSDAMFKIKQLETDFKTELKRIGLEEKKLHAADRDSARRMAASSSLWPQSIISTVFIIGFIAVMYSVFTGGLELAGTTKDAAMLLLGILSAGITQILNFFFGSSSGSKEKTQQMLNK